MWSKIFAGTLRQSSKVEALCVPPTMLSRVRAITSTAIITDSSYTPYKYKLLSIQAQPTNQICGCGCINQEEASNKEDNKLVYDKNTGRTPRLFHHTFRGTLQTTDYLSCLVINSWER